MKNLKDTIQELENIAKDPGSAVRNAMNATGKKAVGCFPIYTPEEVVYAAGYLPVGMWGGQMTGSRSAKYLQGFCCSIMRANTEQALAGKYDFLSAVIITSYCDTLKCIIEDWKVAVPHLIIIPIVYPQNRKIDAGKEYFVEELKRTGRELEALAGTEITDSRLTEAIDLYDIYRKEMQEFSELAGKCPDIITPLSRHLIIKAGYFMDKSDYIEKIKIINDGLRQAEKPETENRKKVILTGLMAEPDGLLEIFEENGLTVVADDLAQEGRQFRTLADKGGDPWHRMAKRLSEQDGCSFLYDEKKSRCELLADLKKKYDADAVIFCQLKFCDPEEFDYPLIKKKMAEENIPLLYLEIEQQMDSVEQLRTRVQGFVEMLD